MLGHSSWKFFCLFLCLFIHNLCMVVPSNWYIVCNKKKKQNTFWGFRAGFAGVPIPADIFGFFDFASKSPGIFLCGSTEQAAELAGKLRWVFDSWRLFSTSSHFGGICKMQKISLQLGNIFGKVDPFECGSLPQFGKEQTLISQGKSKFPHLSQSGLFRPCPLKYHTENKFAKARKMQ